MRLRWVEELQTYMLGDLVLTRISPGQGYEWRGVKFGKWTIESLN
jgi:hypothetical protein